MHDYFRRVGGSRRRIRLWYLPIGMLASVGITRAEEPSDTPGAAANDRSAQILTPTLGRPVFVRPGAAFEVRMIVPDAAEELGLFLTRKEAPAARYSLQAPANAAASLETGAPLRLVVPEQVPMRTYDLEVRSGSVVLSSPHCVAVTDVRERVRIAQLSNMNIGDIGAPHFDPRLIDELNLMGPDVVVATGDYLDATYENSSDGSHSLADGWRSLVDFFCALEAPVVLACGDHDEISLYSRHAAASPIGLVRIGLHRALVVYDHPGAPIYRNSAQLDWINRMLAVSEPEGVTFVVAHDEFPGLIAQWRSLGVLSRTIRTARIGLWISGGHRDWDGREYRELIEAAQPMLYVRTQQSSSATIDGADGTAHYRVIDLTSERATIANDGTTAGRAWPSIPVGRMHARTEGANDGSLSRIGFTATNGLPYGLDDLSLWLRIRKDGGARPWCIGARLEELIEHDQMWEVRVRFDLPDKSGMRGLIGSGPRPKLPQVSVEFDAPDVIEFREQRTAGDLAYLAALNAAVVVSVRNTGAESESISPLVRLDGNVLAYRIAGGDEPFVTSRAIRLEPGQTVGLQPDLSAIRVGPGRRALQMYVRGTAAVTPFSHPLTVRIVH